MDERGNGLTYKAAGVDIDAGNALVEAIKPLARATARPGADAALGGFGALFDLKAAGFRDPLLVAATDGVGTKLKIAIEAGIHGTVGIDLVVQGAEPLSFLDSFASGRLEVATGAEIVRGIAEGCRQAGCALIGGETAELPGLYAEADYDLAGFAVGAVERESVLPRPDVAPGDAVLGLASSGVHSNGFSLVRRVVALSGARYEAPAPFAPERRLGEALLEPTRIYVKPVLTALREARGIKALAHVTGGGLVENVPRVLPPGVAAEIDLAAVRVPPVFRWIAAAGGVAEAEMLRIFNCGVGMVLVVAEDAAEAVAGSLAAGGETVLRLGRIVPAEGAPATRFAGRLDLAS